ncbi:hypothetical protein EA473_19205 [Natrarchaeobius chitinivorans]|uniref:Uncharacterized protein n=1 Tax=Natrarchaeobius chitinivorans TaxID=1679083 RepID=A0A3N6M4Z0_NATCH|nr:hypothetical protein EA473_19205 [Natrarchaeobius chitinivorans]
MGSTRGSAVLIDRSGLEEPTRHTPRGGTERRLERRDLFFDRRPSSDGTDSPTDRRREQRR